MAIRMKRMLKEAPEKYNAGAWNRVVNSCAEDIHKYLLKRVESLGKLNKLDAKIMHAMEQDVALRLLKMTGYKQKV